MTTRADFADRRAPYAPISAVREFFERIRNTAVPARVDKRFIEKLNVASNNEWALLSALKFLGVVDDHGLPTHSYRLLQTTDRFQDTLRHLVETAYRPLFDLGGATMATEDLENYFRVSSSPSQAKNAARFFQAVCQMADMKRSSPPAIAAEASIEPDRTQSADQETDSARQDQDRVMSDLVLRAKARLLEKLPAARPEWTAAEYQAICDRFLDLLRSLDATPA